MVRELVVHVIDPHRQTVTRVPYEFREPANRADEFAASMIRKDMFPSEYHLAKHATGHAVVMGVHSVSATGLGRGVHDARVWARDDLIKPGVVRGDRRGFRFSAGTAFYDTALLVRECDVGEPPSTPEPLWLVDAAHGGRGTRWCSQCARAFEGGGRCSRCHSARYCGKACQVAAWPAHKASCRPPRPPSST